MICSINRVLARIHSAWFSQDLVHDLQDKLWLEYDVNKQDTGLVHDCHAREVVQCDNPGSDVKNRYMEYCMIFTEYV